MIKKELFLHFLTSIKRNVSMGSEFKGELVKEDLTFHKMSWTEKSKYVVKISIKKADLEDEPKRSQ